MNSGVLCVVAQYLTKMMRVFGVFAVTPDAIGMNLNALFFYLYLDVCVFISIIIVVGSFATDTSSSSSSAADLMPLLNTMSSFRDTIRGLAQAKDIDSCVEILKVCDGLRDEGMVEHGVVLEDRDGMGEFSC